MLAWLWGLIKSPAALLSAINGLLDLVRQVRNLFEKSPVDEQKKAEDKQKDADQKARDEDNTDGWFGGTPS